MVDVDSIKRASELVNSVLYAKGFFEEGVSSNDKLLFKSINDEELSTLESIQDNDKLTINTIYALIQSYDKSKQERTFLLDQLNDKKEIITHFEESNRELNNKNEYLTKINYRQQNEIENLKTQLKQAKQQTSLQERNFIRERQLNASLKTKYEVEIKKKTILINQLQDKLLKRHKKFQHVIEGNNTSFSIDSSFISGNTNIEMDQELEKMMINLSNLITNITLQNDQNIKFINYLSSYLSIITEFLLKKLSNMESNISLPPSPKFYYQNFIKRKTNELGAQSQGTQNNIDISSKISHIIDHEKIAAQTFQQLDKFYDMIINDQDQISNSQIQHKSSSSMEDRAKINELEQQIKNLNQNLGIAIETNEKWSKKFNELERQKKREAKP